MQFFRPNILSKASAGFTENNACFWQDVRHNFQNADTLTSKSLFSLKNGVSQSISFNENLNI